MDGDPQQTAHLPRRGDKPARHFTMLRPHNADINRKSINRVQTLQVLIKTELAKYHKEQQSGTRPYKHIVDRYRIFMKTFSEIVK